MKGMGRLTVLLTVLLCLSTADSFVARGHGAPLQGRRDSAASSQPATPKTRHCDAQMGFPGGGSFLNLGTPEMIVIGACAWALLGPKELYRLSAEAGKFLGEWQQLGLQAKNTFTDALESEMREDEEAKKKETEAAMPVTDFSLTELEETRARQDAENFQRVREQEMEDALPLSGLASDDSAFDKFDFDAIGDELGPQTPSKFADQMSGDINRAIMDQFPAELGTADLGDLELGGGGLADVFEAEEIREEEDMLYTRIAEAENILKMLATEQKVLELRREQQISNAARASDQRQMTLADQRRAALAGKIDERLPPQTPAEEALGGKD